jgi:hypothetical protein
MPTFRNNTAGHGDPWSGTCGRMYEPDKNPVLNRVTGGFRRTRACVHNRSCYSNHFRYINGCSRGYRTMVRLVEFGLGNDAVYAIG